MKYGKYKNENDYLNAEKMYATKLHNALKANDTTSVKSIGQEIIQSLPYTYRDIFDEVIRDTDSELAKKLQPMDYVAFMRDPEEENVMELNEIANLDEVKKALRDKYLKEELGAVQAGYLTLDDLKNQSDDDLRGSWVDWYSDGISPDDFEEGSYDKDTVLKILSDKGTMPTKEEVVKYISDNLDTDALDYNAGWEDVYRSDDPTAPSGKSNRYYDGWNDGLFEKNNTKVGGIAKALTANDLGRSL